MQIKRRLCQSIPQDYCIREMVQPFEFLGILHLDGSSAAVVRVKHAPNIPIVLWELTNARCKMGLHRGRMRCCGFSVLLIESADLNKSFLLARQWLLFVFLMESADFELTVCSAGSAVAAAAAEAASGRQD